VSEIDAYLDDLVRRLDQRRPRELRALLAEAEAHLHDEAEALERGGMARDDAEREAVRRFGPAAQVAELDHRRSIPGYGEIARRVLRSGLLLGSIGGIVVGLSGLIAWAVRAVGGTTALVGSRGDAAVSAADCARRLASVPGAHDCRALALADWSDEVVWYRLALGMLGVLGLLVWYGWRRAGRAGRWTQLNPEIQDAIAAVLFGADAAWTALQGLGASGKGQWFSVTVVAVPAAAWFGLRLVRDLRTAGHT
jgi:hypothetical protein